MTQKLKLEVVDRREFVLGATAAAALLPLGLQSANAKDTIPNLIKKATGGAPATEGKIKLDMPELAENGNLVPFTVTVDSPMTEADHVAAVYVYAPANPASDVCVAHFTPMSGKATMISRMRLGKTQEVLAVAKMSNGSYFMTKTNVKVTIGGCGG